MSTAVQAEATMDTTPDAPVDVSSSSSPLSPSSPSSPCTSLPEPPSTQQFKDALNKMAEEKKRANAQSSVKNMLKMLTKLRSKPGDVKNRKLKITKNIIFTKFIAGVQGAEEFLLALGYERVTSGSGARAKEELVIPLDVIQTDVLNKAIELLQERTLDINAGRTELAAKAKGPRVRCKCGFWGDAHTENMCSVCYKKQYLGTSKAASSPEKKAEAKAPVVRVPCKGPGCNFWGTEANMGMCSSCLKKWQDDHPTPWQDTMRETLLRVKAARKLEDAIEPMQIKKTRCFTCKKRVGITGIECRCRYVFCGKHRYADMHNCPYDHKKQQKRKLERELEIVRAAKFDHMEDA